MKKLILLLLFLGMLGLMTYFRNELGLFSSFAFFLCSFILGILYFSKETQFGEENFRRFPMWEMSIAALLILAQFPLLATIFKGFPIAYSAGSDILPQMDAMLERVMQGEFPYKAIHVPNGQGEFYDIHSPYLTLFWLPFLLMKYLGIDFRWLIYLAFMFVSILQTYFVCKYSDTLLTKIATIFLPAWVLYACIHWEKMIFAHTAEFLIASYYIFLCLSLFSRSVWLRAFALCLCLLTKYLLIFWIPFYLFLVYKNEGKEPFWKITITLVIASLGLYILPVLIYDRNFILNSLKHHEGTTLTFWGWQYILDKGVGIAFYYSQYFGGEISRKIKMLQISQFLLGILALIVPYYYYTKRKFSDYRFFALCCLNLHLVFIYHFIQSPFVYYYIVPVCVSLNVLLLFLASHKSSTIFLQNKRDSVSS
jgi:hypothetical protein